MIQISGEHSKPFWNMLSLRVTEIPPPFYSLSKDKGLRNIGQMMSIENLILGVNSVGASYLILYDSLLQNATANLSQNVLGFLLQDAKVITNYDNIVKKYDCYYKMRHLLQIATDSTIIIF